MFVCPPFPLSSLYPHAATVPIEYSGRVQILDSGDLLISNVRESDAGSYECVRSNEAGSVSGKAYVTVMGKCVCDLVVSGVIFDLYVKEYLKLVNTT